MELYIEFLNFLYELGGAVAETSEGIILFLQRTDLVPGYESPIWMFFAGLFLTVIIPYTIIKWAIPI